MGRRRRPYLPNGVFHLTARTQGHELWFNKPLRSGIKRLLTRAFQHSGARLLAFAVMPNHLHLVVRQGRRPLGKVMQPILRRIALRVQLWHGVEGHVFERRYRDHPCLDPEYVRNAVVYTHINPVRAELCATPDEYAWSSHAQYGAPHAVDGEVVEPTVVRAVLGLFASESDPTLAELASAYLRFVEWRLAFDRYLRAGADETSPSLQRPARPPTYAGDRYWAEHFSGGIGRSVRADERVRERTRCGVARGAPTNSRVDLRDLALRVWREHGSPINLNRVRSRYGGSEIVQVRRAIIRRAALAGHKGVDIARFLRISPATVSRVLSASRKSQPPETA